MNPIFSPVGRFLTIGTEFVTCSPQIFWERILHGKRDTFPFRKKVVLSRLPDGSRVWCPMGELPHLIYQIFYLKKYERLFGPRNGDIVIDIGAHVGVYAIKTAKEIGDTGTVVAVEPHPKTFRLLVKNLGINRIKNVIPVNAAISDSNGIARMYGGTNSWGDSLVFTSDKWVNVKTLSLDSLVEMLGLSVVSLIKINAEGSEKDCLLGAIKLFQANRAKLIIAADHTEKESNEVIETLEGLGYISKLYSDLRSGPVIYSAPSFRN